MGGGAGRGGGGGGGDVREQQQQQQTSSSKNAWIREVIRLLERKVLILDEALQCGNAGKSGRFRFILTEQLRKDGPW